jgi:4-hydroxyproline epimerase
VKEVKVIDSHTAGEPTRLVVAGAPDLGNGPLSDRRARFAREHDRFRSFVVNEPRGSDAVVGGLLLAPVAPGAAAGVVFFNNVGVIGMCGHGTMGLAVTLHHMGRVAPGRHRLETPVGEVAFDLLSPNRVAVDNVASRRTLRAVAVDVPGIGRVVGDVAWGGNWFFLTEDVRLPIEARAIPELTRVSEAIMATLAAAGITGEGGAPIDHVELFGPPSPGADGRSFVLCPGGAYDRSPCGTGTSAKLACLAADGKLAAGRTWVQESVIGSRFEASYRVGADGAILPRLIGEAFVTAEATLIRDPADPFADGIRVR